MQADPSWLIPTIQGSIILILILLAHALRHRHSLAPFYTVMGALTLLGWFASLLAQQGGYWPVPQIIITTLIPALIAGVLLTYALDGPKPARVLMFSIVLLILAGPFIGFFLQEAMGNTGTGAVADFATHLTMALGSAATLSLDFLLLGMLYESLKRLLKALPRGLIFLLVLLFIGSADHLIFSTLFSLLGSIPHNPDWTSIWHQRLLVSLLYGLAILPYFWYQRRLQPAEEKQRPLLASLRQEDMLQKEISTIREEMARRADLVQDLHQRSALFQSLFEIAPAGILICDLEGRVLEANPAAESLLRKDASSEKIHSIQELLPAGIIATLMASLRQQRQSQPVLESIHEQEHAISAVPVTLGEHQQGMALLMQNLSEKQQMEDELIRHDRLESLSVLAGGIAHDFNNLLTGILAGLSLARMQLAEAEPLESMKTLEEVEEQVKVASRLTHQLLTFSKGGEPALKTLRMEDFLDESVRFGLRGSSVTAAFHMEDALWPVQGDQGQLHQVINNLTINAVQAMNGSGQIQVHAKNLLLNQAYKTLPPGRYVRIDICDNGPGVAPELLDRIFDPFFTTKKSGHGLGLASSFSILKRHGGLLEVENHPEGGACFRLYLPPGNPEEEPQTRTITVSQYRARVLVMDDQETILKLLTRMLEKIGLEVTTAKNGEETIILYQQAMASGHKYELVILDLTVPDGMGGQECMRNLMELDPQVRAVVSSGYSDDPVMARASQYGFVDRLAKPYTISDVWALVTRVLPEHARREET